MSACGFPGCLGPRHVYLTTGEYVRLMDDAAGTPEGEVDAETDTDADAVERRQSPQTSGSIGSSSSQLSVANCVSATTYVFPASAPVSGKSQRLVCEDLRFGEP